MHRVLLALNAIILVFLGFPCSASGQDFSIPSGWKSTMSNDSRADRYSAALDAAKALQINPATGFPQDAVNSDHRSVANMLIVLASQDLLNGSSTWKEQVVDKTLAFYESGNADLDNEGQNIVIGAFGLAELAAYYAYGKNSSRITIAQRNFNALHGDFIGASAIQSGTYPRSLNSTFGSKLEGLLFFQSKDLAVAGSGIGAWVALSARLYENTRNLTYLDAAEQSIQFMQTFLVQPSSDSVIAGACFPSENGCTITSEYGDGDDIGYYIEGLSIVANVTNNQTYTQMLDQLILAVVSLGKWQNNATNGILVEDNSWCSKGIFIRGLLEARFRNPSNTGLVALIDTFITVQYNAVRRNAYARQNSYDTSWTTVASPSDEYTTVGQIDALDVLNSAFAIAPIPNNPRSSTQALPISVIVGVAVGGAVVIAAITLSLYIYLRRRRRAREMPIHDNKVNTTSSHSRARGAELLAEPFILPTPAHNRPEKGGSQQRVALLREFLNNDTSSSPSSPPQDLVDSHASITQAGQAIGDSDALRALERSLMLERRRLDDLIESLANRGETESNPPEYEGNHALAHDGRESSTGV